MEPSYLGEVVIDLTLDAALLYVVNREGVTTSSRAGTDLDLLLDGEMIPCGYMIPALLRVCTVLQHHC